MHILISHQLKSTIYSSESHGGNGEGADCHLPFSADKKQHFKCIKTDDKGEGKIPWCSTTADYDKDKKWGYCGNGNKTHDGTGPDGAGSEGLCWFPYQFNGVFYDKCITEGKHVEGKLWCSMTASFDTDGLYGFCGQPVEPADTSKPAPIKPEAPVQPGSEGRRIMF